MLHTSFQFLEPLRTDVRNIRFNKVYVRPGYPRKAGLQQKADVAIADSLRKGGPLVNEIIPTQASHGGQIE
jgi:hypothetical protein